MAKKKTNTYHTMAELREKADREWYSSFSVGDGKTYHTMSEIRSAAEQQGYIKPNVSANNTTALRTPQAKKEDPYRPIMSGGRDFNVLNEANRLKGTIATGDQIAQSAYREAVEASDRDAANAAYSKAANTAIERITHMRDSKMRHHRDTTSYDIALRELQQVRNDAEKAEPLALMRLSDNPTYTETRDEISRLEKARDDAHSKGANTDVYDRAIEALKGYSKTSFALDDRMTSDQRQAMYEDKKRELSRLSDEYTSNNENRALMQWISHYDNNEIVTDEDNQYFIDQIRNTYGVDIAGEVGNLNGTERDIKAAELRQRFGDTDITDADIAVDASREQNEYKRILQEIGVYEREYPFDFYQGHANEADFEEKSKPPVYPDRLADSNPSSMDKLSLYTKAKEYVESKNGYIARNDYTLTDPRVKSALDSGTESNWDVLTKAEKDEYYYLLNTEGEEAAYKYLDSYKTVLQKRATEMANNDAAIAAERGRAIGGVPLLGLASTPARMLGNTEAFLDDALHVITGRDIEPYNAAHRLSNQMNTIMQSDAQYIDEATGGANLFGYTLGDAYQALGSGVEMFIGVGALGRAYPVVMSMTAAQATAKDLYDKGATKEQIIAESAAAGAFEFLFENLSFDIITNKIIGKALTWAEGGSFGKKALAGAIALELSSTVEGTEEVNTDIANYIADILIMKDKSDRQVMIQDYLSKGYSQEEAESKANQDFALQLYKSFVGGKIAGIIGSAGGYVPNAIGKGEAAYQKAKAKAQDAKATRTVSKEVAPIIAEAGGTESVMEEARKVLGDPTATDTKALKKAVARAEKIGEGNIGYDEAVGRVFTELQKSQISEFSTAPSKTLDSIVSSKVSEIASTGDSQLTLKQVSAVESTVKKALQTSDDSSLRANLTAAERKVYDRADTRKIIDQTVESIRTDESIGTQIVKAQKAAADRISDTQVRAGLARAKTEYEDTFTASDDRKTYVGDKAVTPQKFTAVTGSDMTVQMEDGSTAKASEISWGDKDVPAVLGTILDIQNLYGVKFNADTANRIYQAYQIAKSNGVNNVGLFAAGVREAFDRGYINQKFMSSYLTPSVAKIISDAAYAVRTQNEEKFTKKGKARAGKVDESAIQGMELNDKQSAGMEVIRKLSEELGINFVIYKSEKVRGKWVSEYGENSPNGFYKDGTIYVDINAGMSGEGLIMYTVSHELVHFMRDGSKRAFNQFADFLVEHYMDKDTSLQELIDHEIESAKRNGREISYDEAYEEVIARLSESFLTDAHLNNKAAILYKQNKSLAQRILNWLKDIRQKIADAFKGVSPESKAGKLGAKIGAQFDQAIELYAKGIREAAENMAARENTTDEGGVRFSIRRTQDMGYAAQLKLIENGKLNGSDSLYVGIPSASLLNIGLSNAPFAMNQSDYKKTRRSSGNNKKYSSHSVPYSFFQTLPSRLNDIAIAIDNGTKVTLVTDFQMIDNKGNDSYVIAGVWRDQAMESDTVNQIKSAYPLDDFVSQIKRAAERGTLVIVNESKAKDMLATIGVQPSEVSNILNLAKNSLSQIDSKSNTHDKKTMQQSRDADYLSAVERGDMQTAQRMVDEAARAAGYTIKAYHGTSRADRVGNVFLPERATSGPMAFFSSDKQVAEGYSKSKRDTSMSYDPDFDMYETQFRIKIKYRDMPLYKAWGYLPFSARTKITKLAGQLRENWDGDNELILDPDTNEANGGFQLQLKRCGRNAIHALIEQWLNSGTLFNEEQRFIDVLTMTGVIDEFKKIGMDSFYYKDPDARYEKVYDTYLMLDNPFDTSAVDENFITSLIEWYENTDQDYDTVSAESDLWDKNSIDAYDFADRLRSDLENNTTHAWTSIPDSVTDYLKSLGYDSIVDKGGKYSGMEHEVYIPFSSYQIKSAEPVTYDNDGKIIPLSQRFIYGEKDIRYQDRYDDLSFDDYSVEDIFARHYTTHSEAIGEVLQNTADITIAHGRLKNIVSKALKGYLENVDSATSKDLAIRFQLILENAQQSDPEALIDEMVGAVRKVIEDGVIANDHSAEMIDDLKSVFSGRYYLTDEQIADLKDNGYTLSQFRKAMFGKVTIVSRENARRSINGGYMDATELSLEGVFDAIDTAEEIFGINRYQWDEYGYHAPMMLLEAFERLANDKVIPLSEIASSSDMDDIAVQIAAQITGAVVQDKYNSRKNPYVSDLAEKIRKQEKAKSKKRVAEFRQRERERSDRLVREAQAKAKEQRSKELDRRKRTEFRQKIRKIYENLQKMALKPQVNKYIPKSFINQTMEVLNSVNMDNGFQGARADSFRARLEALGRAFRALGEEYGTNADFDEEIAKMMDKVVDQVGDTPLGKMSLDQMELVHNMFKAVQTNIRNRIKLVGDQSDRLIGDYAFQWMGEIDDAAKRGIFTSGLAFSMLRPESFFNVISGGAKNNVGLQVYRMLDEGQLRKLELETRFARMFEDLVNDDRAETLKDRKHMVDAGLVDDNGNPVMITRGMMLSLYMHLLNEDNIRHVGGGGVTVPSISDYYKGKYGKAWGDKSARIKDSSAKARVLSDEIRALHEKLDSNNTVGDEAYHSLSREEVSAIWDEIRQKNAQLYELMEEYVKPLRAKIAKMLTPYEKEWINRAQEFFDVVCKEELNATTMQMYGFAKAVVDNYFPIHTDQNFVEQEFDSIVRDMSLENMGMMKTRTQAYNPILLEDITDVISRQISNVSQYCGLMIPMNNAKRIYNVKTNKRSVADSLNKFDDKAKKYIVGLFSDVVGARTTTKTGVEALLQKARHGLAGSALTLNLKVAMKQAASYPTAAAELGYLPLAKALIKPEAGKWMLSRADKELIYKYSPLLAYRSMGYSSQELGDLKTEQGLVARTVYSKKLRWLTGWIQAVDTATVGRLWYASQYYVDAEFSDLTKGTDEYYKKVAEVFNNVVERTQPNYTVMQRPAILRSTGDVTKMLTMFMTQRLQNFNIVYDAGVTLSKMQSDYRRGKNGVTLQDVNQAKQRMARAVTSQLVSAGVLVGMTILSDALMHKMNPYKDDDDEFTVWSVLGRLLEYFVSAIAGSVWLGSEVVEFGTSILRGGSWSGISLNGWDTAISIVSSVHDLVSAVKDGDPGKMGDSVFKLATSLAEFTGIPYKNAKNLVNAVVYIAKGEFFNFESGDRSTKQNVHRAYTQYLAGNSARSKEIITEQLESRAQENLDKGKSQKEAQKEAKQNLRNSIRTAFRTEYIKARYTYYHDKKASKQAKAVAWDTISKITNFMTSAGVYQDPSVKKTLDSWWNSRGEESTVSGAEEFALSVWENITK